MKLGDAIAREAVVMLAATVIVAWVLGQVPELRSWVNRQRGGCSC